MSRTTIEDDDAFRYCKKYIISQRIQLLDILDKFFCKNVTRYQNQYLKIYSNIFMTVSFLVGNKK